LLLEDNRFVDGAILDLLEVPHRDPIGGEI
jgi:hypothetical protein